MQIRLIFRKLKLNGNLSFQIQLIFSLCALLLKVYDAEASQSILPRAEGSAKRLANANSAFGNKVISLQEYYENGRPPQYYSEILRRIPRGTVWRDEDFQPNTSTIVGAAALDNARKKYGLPDDYEFVWARPKDIVKKPVFKEDTSCTGNNCDGFDIIQGGLGDCWFMSSLNAIADRPSLIQMVVPADNNYDGKGIYHFRFWRSGVWIEVVVDDTLLCRKSETGTLIPLFAINHGNEFWVPLVEKAYAKLYGSYSVLNYGYIFDALTDLTGGIFNILLIKDPATRAEITKTFEAQSLLCLGKSGVEGKPPETVLENGLVTNHAYSITGRMKVQFQGKEVTLFSMRNSYVDSEWNGAWSDGDEHWNALDNETRRQLLDNTNGEFWMAYEDLETNFDHAHLCYLPELSANAAEWETHYFPGFWKESKKMEIGDIAANTQYILSLRNERSNKTIVAIGVYNKAIRLTKKDPLLELNRIHMVKVKDPTALDMTKPVTGTFLQDPEKCEVQVTDPNEALRENVDYLNLENGVYIIIPVYGKTRGFSGEYLLRAYVNSPSWMKRLG